MICQLWSKPEIDIPHDKNHLLYSWKGKVFFSCTMRGDTMDCHIAANGRNKLLLKEAINQFCQYVGFTFSWCNKISAHVEKKSVSNLLKKCKFESLGFLEETEVLIRWVK